MPSTDIYRVDLDTFEGPLDLLLFLIQRDEVDVYDIPIAHITRQYLAMLELMQDLNLDVAGEFILMASTLMAIKSRMLLPSNEEVDEGELVDPRAQLVLQLLEYKRFRAVAERLGEVEEGRRQLFSRGDSAVLPEAPEGELEVGLFELLSAYQQVLRQAEVRRLARPVVKLETIKIEDRIALVQRLLKTSPRLRLFELIKDAGSRLEVIVTFIAILELVRLGEVGARQPNPFEDVYLYRRGS